MNKYGMALAADSAVTLGQKVYHSAEKLYQLSEHAPVGIMTYGSAQIMGVPWSTVIKTYRRKLGDRHFDFVDQYADDFLKFLASNNPLFPADHQALWFESLVGAVWKGDFLDPVSERFGTSISEWPDDAWSLLEKSVLESREAWNRWPTMETVGEGFGKEVVGQYESNLEKLEACLFDGLTIPDQIKAGLRENVALMHEKTWIHDNDDSGIVIAGFGEMGAFPRLVEYNVGTVTEVDPDFRTSS